MRMLKQMYEHKMRSLKTLTMFACYVCIGMTSALLGPTLLHLRTQVHSSLTAVSLLMTTRAVGVAIGAFTSE